MNRVEATAAAQVPGRSYQVFALASDPVTCTPAAHDLAKVGLAAAGISLYAYRAYYHGHAQEVAVPDLRSEGAELSSDTLVNLRNVLT